MRCNDTSTYDYYHPSAKMEVYKKSATSEWPKGMFYWHLPGTRQRKILRNIKQCNYQLGQSGFNTNMQRERNDVVAPVKSRID